MVEPNQIWEHPLWSEIEEVDLIVEGGSYGYGGDWYEHKEIDKEALIKFIEDRERKMLKGSTLAECHKDWSNNA